ncbi:MAG: hypothetical protein IPK17_13755 [Chloroflexi bacterium]|uniref:hypothetical protein n=1 Tax=Candidatus Flexifilum breve TaxID=3140694 RepID=UPI003134A958|nr:hypothetical protein [Chloroflexota bacterium]
MIPEVYSFTLFLMALLLIIALWRGAVRWRVLWLASIGGIGIGQHRAVAMFIPGLVYAAWSDVRLRLRRPRMLIAAALLGLAGLLPYAYLYLRAQAGGAWVYGDPGTLAGLWDQFTGKEGVTLHRLDHLVRRADRQFQPRQRCADHRPVAPRGAARPRRPGDRCAPPRKHAAPRSR